MLRNFSQTATPLRGTYVTSHRRPCLPAVAAWLNASGSLTARLQRHGHVHVSVLQQRSQRLWAQERKELQCHSGHVREVVIRVNGVPAVWARSATPHHAKRGAWKAMAGLGNRPLADILFQSRRIARGAFFPIHIPRVGMERRVIRSGWKGEGVRNTEGLPRWGRSSVFTRKGQPLRVCEVFAPWILELGV